MNMIASYIPTVFDHASIFPVIFSFFVILTLKGTTSQSIFSPGSSLSNPNDIRSICLGASFRRITKSIALRLLHSGGHLSRAGRAFKSALKSLPRHWLEACLMLPLCRGLLLVTLWAPIMVLWLHKDIQSQSGGQGLHANNLFLQMGGTVKRVDAAAAAAWMRSALLKKKKMNLVQKSTTKCKVILRFSPSNFIKSHLTLLLW